MIAYHKMIVYLSTPISLNFLAFSSIAVSAGSRSILDAPKKPCTPVVRLEPVRDIANDLEHVSLDVNHDS